MDTNAVVAIIGGALLAFVVRTFNIVLEWLAKVFGVEPVEPIPNGAHSPSASPSAGAGSTSGSGSGAAGSASEGASDG